MLASLVAFGGILALPLAAAQWTIDPPTTAPDDTIKDCTNWWIAADGDTCESIAEANFITVDQLYAYNPSLEDGCDIVVDTSYCVEQNFGVPPPTTTQPPPSTTTTPGNGVTTPTPIQTGMTENCNKFHKVVSGDQCGVIASDNGVSIEDFYSWNPAVGGECRTLIVGYHVCVGIIGGVPPPTTTTGNGISTPTPTQTGMVGNCNKFHKVVSGDQCGAIADDNSISLDNFYSWNPAVGSDCRTLIVGYNVCVGIVGGVPPPTTTTTGGNGIATPTPTQTGMVKNCNKFHKVVSGDSCPDLASKNSISLDNFYSWNPAVGSDCRTLIVGYHVCVGIVGGAPPTTTMSTTTRPGNGVNTPSPIQTGMVGNCNKFHKVVSGDGCQPIATKYGVSLANFYAWNPAVGSDCRTLIIDYHVCVGIIGGAPVTSTTTKPGNGISTPTPTQTGMVGNCNKFHKVVSGDGCQPIATRYGITLANFYSWNPAVGSDCRTLIIDYHVCVGIVGGSPAPTTTRPGNGVSTPTPTQTGMVGNCNRFYLVKSGDGCFDIAASAGIALNDFYKWNPAVKNDCSGLQPNFYVCTRLIGTPTTTTRGNGVATPTPTQTGMVTNCDTFHKVVSGDQCDAVARKAGITLANFYRWNPAVGNTCSKLLLGYHVCIGLI